MFLYAHFFIYVEHSAFCNSVSFDLNFKIFLVHVRFYLFLFFSFFLFLWNYRCFTDKIVPFSFVSY